MAEIVVSEQEAQVLRVYGTKTNVTENQLKKKVEDTSLLFQMQERKILRRIEPTGRARAVRWELTELGIRLKKQVSPTKQVKAPSTKKKRSIKTQRRAKTSITPAFTMEDVMQAITQYCHPYFERYNRLFEQITDKLAQLSSQEGGERPAIDLAQFQLLVQEIYKELNLKNNYGDVVPLPQIKRALLQKLSTPLPSRYLNDYFMQLEGKRVIDLQIASDPSKVPDPQEGISHAQRGLIYYVTWRKKG
ncbi:MAG: hypothetical protein ACTSRC_18160 [Candidatus Helarchaeota archaeon]